MIKPAVNMRDIFQSPLNTNSVHLSNVSRKFRSRNSKTLESHSIGLFQDHLNKNRFCKVI